VVIEVVAVETTTVVVQVEEDNQSGDYQIIKFLELTN